MWIVFVCLGNICRSPTAEGVMRDRMRRAGRTDLVIDSAGTSGWHVGEQADPRARATARRRGFDLDHLGRQFVRADFERFDLVLAMDHANLRALRALAPDDTARAKVRLLRSFDPAAPAGAEVPDPYYGDQAAFDQVVDICVAACDGLLARVPAPA